jgi:hypothetical protein
MPRFFAKGSNPLEKLAYDYPPLGFFQEVSREGARL